jgi:ATP-dependent DNA ligase
MPWAMDAGRIERPRRFWHCNSGVLTTLIARKGKGCRMAARRRREPSASVLGRYIQPCDPTEVDSPPDGADWIHEIKWDGYQAMTDKNATIPASVSTTAATTFGSL